MIIDSRLPAPLVLKVAALAALVGAGCWLSITLTRQPGSLSTLWLASGILGGVLLTSPRAHWRTCLLAALAANLLVRALHGDAWYSVLGLGAASTLDAWLAAAFVASRVADVTDPAQVARTSAVGALSTIAACALSAVPAAAVLAVSGTMAPAAAFVLWFAAHALGLAIAAPITVIVLAQGRRLFAPPGRRIELALLVALTVAACLILFGQARYPLAFLVHLPLLLLVFRHGFRGVVFGTGAVAIIATAATVLGRGPFTLIPGSDLAERTLLLQLFIASTCAISMPLAIALGERMQLTRRLRDSEQRYRMLAEYSRDLVVRMRADGHRLYLSPSVTEILGWTVDELRDARWDLVHPDDVARLQQALRALQQSGGVATVAYRARHREGRWIWIEAYARLVPGEAGGPPEIIYSGRDVTARIEAEHRLQAIADNMPTIIAQVDRSERFLFANAYLGRLLGVEPAAIVGRTMRDVLGADVHDEIRPRIETVLRGETVTFEIERNYQGAHRYFQATYIPEIDPDRGIDSFYVLISDISRLKRAEHELTLLARYDSLTGLANRYHFNERVESAITRRQRKLEPLALLYLDIDFFKEINDRFGHATGDGVLREFALRLKDSVRESDFVARIGGDEFLILVEDIDVPAVAEIIARKVIAAVRQNPMLGAFGARVTTSVGVAFCSKALASAEELLQLADQALYASKAAGRDTYRLVMTGETLADVASGA